MSLGECIADVTVWSGGEDPDSEVTVVLSVSEIDQGWERELEIRVPLDGNRDAFVKVRVTDLMRMVTDALLAKI